MTATVLRDALHVKETLRRDFGVSKRTRWKKLSADVYVRGMTSTLRTLAAWDSNEETEDLKRLVVRRIKTVKLDEIWGVSSQREVFDLILVKLGLFELLYSLWESPFLAPVRKMRRKL
jgi:hypothetical protein